MNLLCSANYFLKPLTCSTTAITRPFSRGDLRSENGRGNILGNILRTSNGGESGLGLIPEVVGFPDLSPEHFVEDAADRLAGLQHRDQRGLEPLRCKGVVHEAETL